MTSNQYIIQIPEPCTEDWQRMLPDEKGRFCGHCAKTVIDFTQLSDDQIVALLQQNEGKLCGRFSSLQLNRVVKEEPLIKASRSRIKEIFAALLILLTTRELNASNANDTKITIVQTPPANQVNTDKDSIQLIEAKGIIIDSITHDPIPYAIVRNIKTGVEKQSDEDGNFSITANLGDTITIIYLGYYNYDQVIRDSKTMQCRLHSKEIMLSGDIEIIRSRPIDQIRHFFHTGRLLKKNGR